MHVTKRINMPQLQRELDAAGVAIPNGLGWHGTDTDGEVYTFTNDVPGAATELPAAAVPVVNAHVAPPVVSEYAQHVEQAFVTTSSGSAWKEIARLPCDPSRIYLGSINLIGVDPGPFAAKSRLDRWLWKRLATGGAVIVGSSQLSEISDGGLTGLDLRLVATGNDVVIQVKGANNQNVSWLVRLDVVTYALGGLS